MQIIHRETQKLIVEGKRGQAITPFEGNYYISNKCFKTERFRVNYVPSLCPYKFPYVWLGFHRGDGLIDKSLGWKYWFPNP